MDKKTTLLLIGFFLIFLGFSIILLKGHFLAYPFIGAGGLVFGLGVGEK